MTFLALDPEIQTEEEFIKLCELYKNIYDIEYKIIVGKD